LEKLFRGFISRQSRQLSSVYFETNAFSGFLQMSKLGNNFIYWSEHEICFPANDRCSIFPGKGTPLRLYNSEKVALCSATESILVLLRLIHSVQWSFPLLHYDSSSQNFLHVDPQFKYTNICRPRGLAQQLLIQGTYVSKYIFDYFVLEMHDKVMHNPKIYLEFRDYSVPPIRPRDCLSIPWMVQLTPGVNIELCCQLMEKMVCFVAIHHFKYN